MTQAVASAPGKLVLLGEYAVLAGAPALVQAVDRRARARVTECAGATWEIISPTLGLEARLRLPQGEPDWLATPPGELKWVATLLAAYLGRQPHAACRVELDSAPFYIGDGAQRTKLGLGSSAALGVALLGALHALDGRPTPSLEECIAAHRAIQGGHGSGIDIAAAHAGGLLVFQLQGDAARIATARWPAGLRWCCVYSGRPASTQQMLATVAHWGRSAPEDFALHMRELATISSRGIDAMAANDAEAFLTALHAYAQALAAFGAAAGTDIASRGHRVLGALAESCGCFYKSCGAGGGDVGITCAVEDGRIENFAARALAGGYRVIDLQPDPLGVALGPRA